MKCPLVAIVRRHTEWGPDAAGATSANLLPRRPRRGQAAAPLALSRLKWRAQDADPGPDSSSRGLTAIILRPTGALGGGRGLRRRSIREERGLPCRLPPSR